MNIRVFNKKIPFPYIFFVFIFVILTVISELVFISNNDSVILRRFYLSKAKQFSEANNVNDTYKYLFKATDLKINDQLNEYKDIFSKDEYKMNKNFLIDSLYSKTYYLDYLKNIDIQKMFTTKDEDFLRIYYNLALIANDNGNSDDVLPYLQIAMFLEPELSHIHLEIADYYFSINQKENAFRQLDTCMDLKNASGYCEYFKSKLLVANGPQKLGFYKIGIDSQYELIKE